MKYLRLFSLLLAVFIGSYSAAQIANAYGRTITNPVDNFTLSSSVMRSELQTLEDEITGLFSISAAGSATSTTLILNGGVVITASSTISNLGTGLVKVSNGLLGTDTNTYATFSYPFPLLGLGTTSPIMLLASTTIGNGTATGGLTVSGTATTTNLIVTGSATSTFAGDITMTHSHFLTSHGSRGDGSDGYQIVANNYTQVATFGVGNTANSLFLGGVNIDGATRLATSLTGLAQLTSGAVSAVATSSLSVGASITSSGTLGALVGGTASALSLNMANANTWTALQSFANASSTQFSAGTNTFYVDSNGRVQAKDTTNGWTGVISPTHSFVLQTGTTTTWTATTSDAYVPTLTMPASGILRQVRCVATSTQAFLTVMPYINTTSVTPSALVASTTVGVVKFTANNTFNAGDTILMYTGSSTPATANKSTSCTFDYTET